MTDLMAKDLGLAVSAAREKRVPVVVAPAAQQLYRMASSHGLGREDFSVGLQVPEAVERRRPGLGVRKEIAMPPLVLSSDSHVFEPPDLWQTRIDKAFRDRAPRIERIDGGDQSSSRRIRSSPGSA